MSFQIEIAELWEHFINGLSNLRTLSSDSIIGKVKETMGKNKEEKPSKGGSTWLLH